MNRPAWYAPAWDLKGPDVDRALMHGIKDWLVEQYPDRRVVLNEYGPHPAVRLLDRESKHGILLFFAEDGMAYNALSVAASHPHMSVRLAKMIDNYSGRHGGEKIPKETVAEYRDPGFFEKVRAFLDSKIEARQP